MKATNIIWDKPNYQTTQCIAASLLQTLYKNLLTRDELEIYGCENTD